MAELPPDDVRLIWGGGIGYTDEELEFLDKLLGKDFAKDYFRMILDDIIDKIAEPFYLLLQESKKETKDEKLVESIAERLKKISDNIKKIDEKLKCPDCSKSESIRT